MGQNREWEGVPHVSAVESGGSPQPVSPQPVSPQPGSRLREIRLRRGLSLRQLAQQGDVSIATLSAVENGRRSLSGTRLDRIAQALDTPVADLGPGLAPEQDPSAPVVAEASVLNWRVYAPLDLNPPLTAALEAFLEFGYHGATMRDIARRAGLSVPGVYHHYASKQAMLVALLDVTMTDLDARTTSARAEGQSPAERFALLVECLALYHTHRRELGFVGASEMRSLIPQERLRLANARRAQQSMVDQEVEQACHDGSFTVSRPHEASRAVVTMCTALPQWFDGQGPDTAEQIATQYVEFALDLMRSTPASHP